MAQGLPCCNAQGSWLLLRVQQALLQLSEEADTADAALFTEYVRLSGHIRGFTRMAPGGFNDLPWKQ